MYRDNFCGGIIDTSVRLTRLWHDMRFDGYTLQLIFSERELTFTFAISSVRLSVVCNVGAPYSGD